MDIIKANKMLKDYIEFNMGIVGIVFSNDNIYHLHFSLGEKNCFQENNKIENTLVINSLDQLHFYIDENMVCENCLKDFLTYDKKSSKVLN